MEDVDSGVEGDTAEDPIEYGAQQDVGFEAAVLTGVDPDDADAEDLLADRLAIASEKAELDDCEGDDGERIENRKKIDGEAADQQGHGKGTRSPQGIVDDGAARRLPRDASPTAGRSRLQSRMKVSRSGTLRLSRAVRDQLRMSSCETEVMSMM